MNLQPAETRASKTWLREFCTLQISKERTRKFLLKAFFKINQNHLENTTVYQWYKHRHLHQQGRGARDSFLVWEWVKMLCDKRMKDITSTTYFKILAFFYQRLQTQESNLSIKSRRRRYLKERWKPFLWHFVSPITSQYIQQRGYKSMSATYEKAPQQKHLYLLLGRSFALKAFFSRGMQAVGLVKGLFSTHGTAVGDCCAKLTLLKGQIGWINKQTFLRHKVLFGTVTM